MAADRQGYIYGRTRNPTQSLLEARMASLEGAEAGLAVVSGMAAIGATFFTLRRRRGRHRPHALRHSVAFSTRGLTRSACACISPT
jgi:methionine-gamma-lyase